jgi:hypothetical protein
MRTQDTTAEELLDEPFAGIVPNPSDEDNFTCTIKRLPPELAERAAEIAVQVNTANASPSISTGSSEPARLIFDTTRFWGREPRELSGSFLDDPPRELRKQIMGHLNAWSTSTNKSFGETRGRGEIRISFRRTGFWSFIGTDVLSHLRDGATMNLDFRGDYDEKRMRRLVRHEAGHTLGCEHEHLRREVIMRIDRQRAYDHFERTEGWSRRKVDEQVLTPLEERSVLGTPLDQHSIMCYHLPGKIMKDRRAVPGGDDISDSDHAFAARMYPKSL